MKGRDGAAPGYLAFVSLSAALGGFLFGYDSIIVSGAIPLVKARFALSAGAEGLFVASSLIGCMASAPFAGELSDRLGRRPCLLAAAALTLAGSLFSVYADSVVLLTLARFVSGLGVGVASMVCPLYIAEVAPPDRRGRLVSGYQLAITLGICAALFVNAGLSAVSQGPSAAPTLAGVALWRMMFATQIVPSAAFALLAWGLPESPRWLVKAQRGDPATVLTRLLGPAQAERTREDIAQAVREEAREGLSGYRDLLRPRYRYALMVAVGLALGSELSGITVVFYYGPAILSAAGLTLGGALGGFVSIGLVNMLATFVALGLIDRVGRRRLLLVGTLGAIVALVATGALLGKAGAAMALVTAICAYVACFAFSLGPVKFVVASEIFPNRIRGRAIAVFIFVAFAAGAAINQAFPLLRDSVGPPACFFLFSAVLALQVPFVLFVMPETAGRSLEDIERDPRGLGQGAGSSPKA